MIDQHTIGPDPVFSDMNGPAGCSIDEASMSVTIDGIVYTFPSAEAATKAKAAMQNLAEAAARMEEMSQLLKVLHRRNRLHIVK